MPDLSGKTALITGATSGLGFDVAVDLARQGATVVFGVRNLDKGKRYVSNLRSLVPKAELLLPSVPLDVADPDSVQAFAGWYMSQGLPLHILVNNAGVSFTKNTHTRQGVGLLAQTNYLGAYLLTRLLEKKLVECKARVVNVSSITHRMAAIRDPHVFLHNTMAGQYRETKCANVLFTYELQRRLGPLGVESAAADPGAVKTGIWEHMALTRNPPLKWIINALYAPPEDGAVAIAHAAAVHWADDIRGKLPGPKPEEDFRYYARGLFASPIITAWDGSLSEWDLRHLIQTASWRTVAVTASVLDWPIRWCSNQALGAQPRLVRSSAVTYDAKLAADLWDESAKVAGVPLQPDL